MFENFLYRDWSNNLYDQYRFNQVAGGMFAEYLKCDVKKGENLIPIEHSFLRSLDTFSQLFRYFRQLFCIFPRRHVGSVMFDPVHCHILT